MLSDDQGVPNDVEEVSSWRRISERRLAYRVLHLWRDVAGDSGLPSLRAFRAVCADDVLANSFILALEPGNEPRFAEIGCVLLPANKVTLVGRGVSAAKSGTLIGEMASIWKRALDRKVPIIREESFVDGDNFEVLYRGIMLPITSDGKTFDTLFSVVNGKIIEEDRK